MLSNCIRAIWVFLCISLLFCAALPLSYASEDISDAIARDKTQSENAKIYTVGILADDLMTREMFDSAAEYLNFEVDYVQFESFDDLFKATKNQQIDFISNFTYTKARAKDFYISQPTNIEYDHLYTQPEKDFDITKIHRIGIDYGSIFNDWVARRFPNVEIVNYHTAKEGIEMIQSNRVDAVIDSMTRIRSYINANLEGRLLNDLLPIMPVSIATAKAENKAVLDKIEEFIHTAEIQGLISQTMEEFSHQVRVDFLRTLASREGVNLDRPLKIKFENLPHYSEYDKAGNVSGISVDIIQEACDILALECEIVSHNNERWPDMLKELKSGQIDILAPTMVTREREKALYFSQAFYQSVAVVLKRKGFKPDVYRNVTELVVERVGVVGEDYYDFLMAKLLPNKDITKYEDRESLLHALESGEVDYIISDQQMYNELLISTSGLTEITKDEMIGEFNTSNIAYAFPRTELGEHLSYLFSRAINMMDIKSITSQYNLEPDWQTFVNQRKHYMFKVKVLLVVIVVGLSLVVFWLYRQSILDRLSGLYNRRGLYHKYKYGIDAQTSLAYFDLNNFKYINDTYGHEIGDEVLKFFSRRLRKRWPGKVYRIGGDEFVGISHQDGEALMPVLQKLTQLDFQSRTQPDLQLVIQCSVGHSFDRNKKMILDDVLHLADEAMYKHKMAQKSAGQA